MKSPSSTMICSGLNFTFGYRDEKKSIRLQCVVAFLLSRIPVSASKRFPLQAAANFTPRLYCCLIQSTSFRSAEMICKGSPRKPGTYMRSYDRFDLNEADGVIKY